MKKSGAETARLTHTGLEPAPPVGSFSDVDGRRLFTHRSGDGEPAVVLLPGAGAVGLDYWNLHEASSAFAVTILYDRAGTGWSERIPLPRSSAEATDELRSLLTLSEIPAPYVLVGHSLGGLYARHFAQRFPEDVAGLVLLDPAHEDMRAHMPKEVVENWDSWDPEQSAEIELPQELLQFYRSLFLEEMAAWPSEIREALADAHASPAWIRVGAREASNLNHLYTEVRAAGPWPDIRTILLCSMETDAFKRAVSPDQSEALLQAEIEGRRRLYNEIAASIPNGHCRPVGGGHVTMPFRETENVIRAIRDVGK